MLSQIIVASFVGSVFALAGGILLLWREQFARRISLVLVSFAIGSLTGAAFFELIPEALHDAEYGAVAPWIIVGIFAIFLFEKIVHWSHFHEGDEEHVHDEREHNVRSVTAAVLLGDSIHNFIDGIVIALAWNAGAEIGIATTIAVFFHEVPQEIGDFGILLHLGYSRAKVLWYNVVSALMTPVGAVAGYMLLPSIEPHTSRLLAFAAGSFIYIAVSDLLPELHRHQVRRNDLIHLAAIVLGVFSIVLVGTWLPE